MNNVNQQQQQQADVVIAPILSVNNPPIVNGAVESYGNKSVAIGSKTNKRKIVKGTSHRVLPRTSEGEIKLNTIIDELQKITIEEQEEEISRTNLWNCMRLCRRRLAHFFQNPKFHYLIIILVITDLMVVLVDLVLGQLSSPCLTMEEMIEYNTTIQRESCLLGYSVALFRVEVFCFYFSALLLTLFVIEIFLSIYTFGWRYYKNVLYLTDAIVVFTSYIMELYFHYGNIGRAGRAASAIIVLRLWKIIRAIHAVAHSITLKNHLLIKKLEQAKILLEAEKEQTEETLEKQEIKLEYFANLLTTMGKLPSKNQVDNHVNTTWRQRKQSS